MFWNKTYKDKILQSSIQNELDLDEKRIKLINALSKILSVKNSELCFKAKNMKSSKFEEIFQDNQLYQKAIFETFCKRNSSSENSWYRAIVFIGEFDIDNDAEKDKILKVKNNFSSIIYVLNGDEIDYKKSDEIYKNEFYPYGEKTALRIWGYDELGELISYVITASNLPKNKISDKALLKGGDEIAPFFTMLFYDVSEIDSKSYIYVENLRFIDDGINVPSNYLWELHAGKKELKCLF